MSTDLYSVVVEKFAGSHYISKFERKYHRHWDVTLRALTELFKRIKSTLGTDKVVEIICDKRGIKICKAEFRIAGPGKSKHSSGNRAIIAVDASTEVVRVLLVYSKIDLKGAGSETAKWQRVIKANYPEYRDLF